MAGTVSYTSPRKGRGSDRYLGLIQELPLRPIRSEAELDRAIAMLDSLSDRETLRHNTSRLTRRC